MSIIELKNIKKEFRGKGYVTQALKEVTLKVEEGDFLAIIGTSGSGKTTLLNIIGLLDEKSEGKYILDNHEIGSMKEREMARYRNECFGFFVQDFALINDYSVMDNIRLPLEYSKKKLSKREAEEKIKDIAKRLGIGDKLRQSVKNLSGGQKQRVAIARALVNDPKVILADEPTGSLDKSTTNEILEIFLELNKSGKTLVLITHDESVAAKSGKILRLEDGVLFNETL